MRRVLGLTCLLVAGCGSEPAAEETKDPCAADPIPPAPGSTCIAEVRGSVIDAQGSPLSQIAMSVCGAVCWYGESDAAGGFTVSVGAHIPPDLYSTLPHGRPSRANFYFPLPPVASPNVDVGELMMLDLPATGPKLTVKTDKVGAPAQSVSSGDVSLEVPEGTYVKLDVEDVALKEQGKELRVLAVPDTHFDRFVGSKSGITQLYAFAPFEAAFVDAASGDPALARLRVDNTSGLPAGGAVEFLALGSYLFPDWVEPARFDVVATGTVSSDGKSIEMDTGQGLGYLTWVGVRPKP